MNEQNNYQQPVEQNFQQGDQQQPAPQYQQPAPQYQQPAPQYQQHLRLRVMCISL